MCRKWSKDNSTIFAKCRKRHEICRKFFRQISQKRQLSKLVEDYSTNFAQVSRCDENCRRKFDIFRQMSMKRDELCRIFSTKFAEEVDIYEIYDGSRQISTNFDGFFRHEICRIFFRQISPTFFDRKFFLFPTTFDNFRQGIVERCRILSEEVELCRIFFDKIRFPSTQSTAFFDSIRQSSTKSVGTMKRLSNDVEPCRMMSREYRENSREFDKFRRRSTPFDGVRPYVEKCRG